MYLQPYCAYNALPCIVHHNEGTWSQDSEEVHDIQDGDYLAIHAPPPNEIHATLPTRCVAVAIHQGIDLDIVDLVGDLPAREINAVPNPYQVMTDQDVEADPDSLMMLQHSIGVLRAHRTSPVGVLEMTGYPYNQLQRLGEAAVPGPPQDAEPPSKWAIGKVRFNQELWYAKSPFTLTTGADVFSQHLGAFESRIIAKRIAIAKANRASDVNRVFKDVRKPMPVPVSMLVAKSVAHVVEVVDEGSVVVDNSDAIQHAAVLESCSGPMHVIHIEEGQVLTLTQTLLHCPVMPLTPITLSRWKQAIQAKKHRSATGLDAVARQDLLSFPDELHLQLIQIFAHAEKTGQWPRQLLQGAVFSLEKVPQAQTVNEYRPITVMPLAYRIYTTIRSREVLLHLRQHVPPTLLVDDAAPYRIGPPGIRAVDGSYIRYCQGI
ncbi:unnamed protein product [Cladocopium goreaui]|uniref:Uncharacterized protein n=1 Tax=Cladocopium goreaui TaxID=2562237 RepID=A0A9P1GQW2_9DINO|nr:unnamed protein product [Cladocopium goreaui]